ncbi:uncharacterized protein METZ01_LOCUS175338, partial [marine metagenome]
MSKPAGTFPIEQSLMFSSADTPSFSRTPTVTSNRKTYTWSGWVKKCGIMGDSSSHGFYLYSTDGNSDNHNLSFYRDTLYFNDYDYPVSHSLLQTNRKFRDPSAWYHIVLAWDTTQATAANRVKLYVNGVQETSFSTATYPAEDYEGFHNYANGYPHKVGNAYTYASNYALDGYIAEVHMIDGTAHLPTKFGESDAATGQWIPKEVTNITYGTNGYYLKFEDSYPGIVTSASGGTITTDGDYKVHVFNSSSTFTVNTISGGAAAVDFLVIGGGGGGGYSYGGGGGAGGYRTSYGTSGGNSAAELPMSVTTQAYTITVGDGG